jgi:hypothetical protein
MSEAPRISVEEAHRKTNAGEAMLVCAYEDETRCEPIHLEGSITMSELKAQLPSLRKEQQLIFYCT